MSTMSMEMRLPKGKENRMDKELMMKLLQDNSSICSSCNILRSKFKDVGSASRKICAAKGKEEKICAAKEEVVVCLVCKICAAKGVDSWSHASCKICVAKAAALNRIKVAGGDSIKAAKDSASRACGDILVIKMAPVGIVTEEDKLKPTGYVKKKRVPQAYIDGLLADPQLTPLRAVSEDYFQKNPERRENSIAAATTVLMSIERDENILVQFFDKGFAEMELVDCDYEQ